MSSHDNRAHKHLGGKIKEGSDKLTGDRDLESAGQLDQADGDDQEAFDDLKDAFPLDIET